jgi:hypothetical protein
VDEIGDVLEVDETSSKSRRRRCGQAANSSRGVQARRTVLLELDMEKVIDITSG